MSPHDESGRSLHSCPRRGYRATTANIQSVNLILATRVQINRAIKIWARECCCTRYLYGAYNSSVCYAVKLQHFHYVVYFRRAIECIELP